MKHTLSKLVITVICIVFGLLLSIAAHAAPPINDDFVNAITINQPGVVSNSSTVEATQEAGEPVHLGGAVNSVWWRWVAPTSDLYTFSTEGSEVQTIISPYSGATLQTLSPLFIIPGEINNSIITLSTTVTAGTTYYIAVTGLGGDEGNVVFQIKRGAYSDNNYFSNPTLIKQINLAYTGSNLNTNLEENEPDHMSSASNSSWWVWHAPISGSFEISTAGSDFNTVLSVYTGDTLETLSLVGENNDSGSLQTSSITIAANEGESYRIAVDGYATLQGNISLQVLSPTPVNDAWSAATVLEGRTVSSEGHNVGATFESNEPPRYNVWVAGTRPPNTVWWKWQVPGLNDYCTVSTEGSNFDTYLSVYRGEQLISLTHVVSNDNAIGGTAGEVLFLADDGVTYYFSVSGAIPEKDFGSIALQVNCPLENDNWDAAYQLSLSNIYNRRSDNFNATVEEGEPDHLGAASHSVWWKWRAPRPIGDVSVSTIGSDFNTVLAIYSGDRVDSLIPVASNDDSNGLMTSEVTYSPVSETTYYFAVDGVDQEQGRILVNLDKIPPLNDDWANALLVEGTNFTVHGYNVDATTEVGEPNHTRYGGGTHHSVWWVWQAPVNGDVTFSTAGSNFETVLGVYTGSAVNNLLLVAGDKYPTNQINEVTFNATKDTLYYLAVDSLWNNDFHQGYIVLNSFSSTAYQMKKALLALRAVTNQSLQHPVKVTDIDSDGRVGVAEAIQALTDAVQ